MKAELKPYLWLAIVVVLYVIVRAIYGAVAGHYGVITPGGALSGSHVALAFATMVLRVAAIVVVPFIVVYKLVMRGLRRWIAGAAR